MKKTDTLTEDVYNIDVFQVLLKYEISRSKRYPCPLTLLQIETTPTAFNPEALRDAPLILASALNNHLRAADIPARSGNLPVRHPPPQLRQARGAIRLREVAFGLQK